MKEEKVKREGGNIIKLMKQNINNRGNWAKSKRVTNFFLQVFSNSKFQNKKSLKRTKIHTYTRFIQFCFKMPLFLNTDSKNHNRKSCL